MSELDEAIKRETEGAARVVKVQEEIKETMEKVKLAGAKLLVKALEALAKYAEK